jgi:cytochrome c oxidase cbb3-type subunit 3
MVPPGTTASVTLASGRNVQGKLDAIDEFSISLITPDGQRVTFERQSAKTPEVVIHNPLREHLTMLRTLSDDQVHNLTAYLVTLK